jgi:epoxide hydrolase-like predicted phosphatase
VSEDGFSALLVDYGGVLTSPLQTCMREWCESDGVDVTEFADVLRAWRDSGDPKNPVYALERGELDAGEFERELAARLRTRDGRPLPADGLLARMFLAFRQEPTMVDLVRRAHAAGIRTGLVSNSWGVEYPELGWDEMFDAVVISGQVGMRKPEPAIYRYAAEQVGVPPEKCVFVDDLPGNVRGAEDVGMAAILHTDPAATRARLGELFGPMLADG